MSAQEWLYHVDAQDLVLGRVPRDQAHERGLLHRAGCVFLWRAPDLVYLTRRAPQRRYFAGCVDLACSFHVSYGETYLEACHRELGEETGIQGASPERLGHVVVGAPDPMHVEVFGLEHLGEVRLDPQEAVDGAWWTLAQARDAVRSRRCTSWLARAWSLLDTESRPSR